MKKIFLFTILSILTSICFSQPIPTDSMFLAQLPPTGITPKRFFLPVSSGSFTAERIAITNDGKEIYYSVVYGYYPTNGDTIKCFKYVGNKWIGPFNLFNNYNAPGLSPSGDTLYFENNMVPYETYFSVRNGTGWSNPKRIFHSVNSVHYFQITNNGNRYSSSISNPTLGASDWCRLFATGTDSTAVSIGLPICTSSDNLDFFVSRDESFLIIVKKDLYISYHKNNGGWTNPKSLGSTINFGLGMWGPFVTPDNKYLFYTTGTDPNYTDTYVYWSRVDGLIDSLRHTNFIPYLKYQIPQQTDTVNVPFNFTIPDSTFIDDDGNNTLRYSAKLNNGSPLPSWLSFDSTLRRFYGIPTSPVFLTIKVIVTDAAGASTSCNFYVNIVNRVGINKLEGAVPGEYKLLQNFPNPFNPVTNISFSIPKSENISLKIYNILGKEVADVFNGYLKAGNYNVVFDANNLSSGIYFYTIKTKSFIDTKKMIALK